MPTPVDAFISRPQLLETVLGAKVRSVSRRVLDQTRQKCPHLDLRQQWQCFHAMFDATVTSAFIDVLNRNLVAAGQPSVTPGEFHCFVAMFLMHCVEVGGVEGVRERCVGKRGDSVKGLISSDRYSVLKRHFTLLPHDTPQTKRVRVVVNNVPYNVPLDLHHSLSSGCLNCHQQDPKHYRRPQHGTLLQ